MRWSVAFCFSSGVRWNLFCGMFVGFDWMFSSVCGVVSNGCGGVFSGGCVDVFCCVFSFIMASMLFSMSDMSIVGFLVCLELGLEVASSLKFPLL